ncbi:hypothetical protein V496_01044 [Pseudogymnoascus sp. VKM F-4515 (FW-2607)]|nr:hypothetical protein V496_01044 [Pseudogymnoascus sp. VKM F-4515 (FW-2607)]KFY95934.1 hypothetical protein V498_03012 [Pseudogymnoascus sp. VKM F-4517 (FW-2822)]
MLVYADPLSKLKAVQYLTTSSDPCQVEVFGYEVEFCIYDQNTLNGEKTTKGRTFNATLGDTDGIATPFNWKRDEDFTPLDGTDLGGAARVRSLGYTPHPGNSSNCKPMQLMVYDNQGFTKIAKYFTPGKGPGWCITFYEDSNSTITAYSGVNMLLPTMDRNLLIGGGDEVGSYIIPMCPSVYGCPEINPEDIFG